MRLQLSFIALLLIASISTSVIWKNLATARDGDDAATIAVFTALPAAFVSILLLCRIVLRALAARHGEGN